jgi:hypothetical protein
MCAARLMGLAGRTWASASSRCAFMGVEFCVLAQVLQSGLRLLLWVSSFVCWRNWSCNKGLRRERSGHACFQCKAHMHSHHGASSAQPAKG